MIDVGKLKFGDAVYIVNEKNNVFSKKRITMTDENGVEWYRYDRDHWEYSINKVVYCGRVEFQAFGEICFDCDYETELHFRKSDGYIQGEKVVDVIEFKTWFHTQEEAEAYAKAMKLQKPQI